MLAICGAGGGVDFLARRTHGKWQGLLSPPGNTEVKRVLWRGRQVGEQS